LKAETSSSLRRLKRKERLQLLKFVASFAWADLHVSARERAFIQDLIRGLDLPKRDRAEVEGWLQAPPGPDEVDPGLVPHAHRRLFLDAVRGVVEADGRVSPEEAETLGLFEALTRRA
jgi:uncharacterized tellurite resistance protein B-like protein